jgi:NADH-quinone oxidoreductase subunit M
MTAALLILIPLLSAIAAAAVPSRLSRWVALVGALALLVHTVVASIFFGAWGAGDGGSGFSIQAEWPLIPAFGISLALGADSVAMCLILLNALLIPLCVWGSFTAISTREREYYGWMMALAAAVNGVFLSRDIVVFYVCFEFTLVPLYFLIAIFGGENRARASLKFFLYTFTGSLFALAGILYVAWSRAEAAGGWTFAIEPLVDFAASNLTLREQGFVLLALLAGFGVKVPLFPVHTWLPLAHTEAPTAGSVLLAGVLLKLGTYGLFRFVLPMLPLAVEAWAPTIGVLCVVGILYAALICWVQEDVKRLIAYSSVSHLGFCVLGLFALNPLGVQGSVLYMINHGLSTGALFLCIGMMYERFHTRDMNLLGGLARRMPIWAFFMVFFTMSSLGLPGLNGFVGEFLCLIGTYTATADATTGYSAGRLGPHYALAAGIGMILGAMYLLIMLGKVLFGPLKISSEGGHGGSGHSPAGDGHGSAGGGHGAAGGHGGASHGEEQHGSHAGGLPVDLTAREIIILVPLAALCVVIGFKPHLITDAVEGSVSTALAGYTNAAATMRAEQPAAAPWSPLATEVASASPPPTPQPMGASSP